jgi:hypothetical protein
MSRGNVAGRDGAGLLGDVSYAGFVSVLRRSWTSYVAGGLQHGLGLAAYLELELPCRVTIQTQDNEKDRNADDKRRISTILSAAADKRPRSRSRTP